MGLAPPTLFHFSAGSEEKKVFFLSEAGGNSPISGSLLPVGIGKVRVNQRTIGVGSLVAFIALLLNLLYDLLFYVTLYKLCLLFSQYKKKDCIVE